MALAMLPKPLMPLAAVPAPDSFRRLVSNGCYELGWHPP